MPWKRRAPSIAPSAPFRDQVVSSMDVAHIMERRAHSNLDEVAEDAQGLATPFRNQSPRLERRMLPWFSRQEEHDEDKMVLHSNPKESCRIQWSPGPLEMRPSVNISGTDPPVFITVVRDGSIERKEPRYSFDNSKMRNTATTRSESQSSLSQAISCTPSPSCSRPSSISITPEHYCHCRSFYPYAPYAGGESSRDTNVELLHSPHTFGMVTPPQSRSSSKSRGETHFNFKQTPPPLPPLDHPVFHEKVNEFGVLSTKRLQFPVADKIPRHAQSLPSIDQTTTATNNIGKHSRKSSQSNVGVNTQDVQNNPRPEFVKKAFHSQNSSNSSRRFSAEYSAKQASSLSHDGCWEVGVSKAIISLSLQGQQVRSLTSSGTTKAGSAPGVIAFPGQACGYNKPPSGQVVSLGSPFLQNPLPRNLISNSISNDHSKTVKTRYRIREPEIARDDGRIRMMAHADNNKGRVTAITISSTNPATSGKPKQPSSGSGAPSLEKAPSWRTGSWLSSSRSDTTTPPRQQGEKAQGSSSLLVPQLTIIGPTPEASPISPITPTRRIHHKSTPTMPQKSMLPPVIEKSYSSGSVKRKAEEADVEGDKTPPKETREHRATFAPDPRSNRLSIAHAPSSFNRSKRVRLTNTSEGGRSTMSRTSHPGSVEGSPGAPSAKNTGSWSSRGSHGPRSASYFFSRDGPPLTRSASRASHTHSVHGQGSRAPSRRSLSQVSIPISALVSPHAPSIAHSGTFHMRDPRKPPPVQSTPWTLSFPTHWEEGESRWTLQSWVARGGSPRHAWLFFIGFILFPLWWVAAFLPIPRTRRIGGTDAEKGVMLDDPQVEHDAKSWRFRCRVMTPISLITYIPFIVLVVIFAPH